MEKTIPELLGEIIDAVGFDMIRIIYVDTGNRLLQEADMLDKTGDETDLKALTFLSLEKIINLLGVTKNALILTNALTRVGQTVCKKVNLQYAQEVFIPLFDGSSKIAGIIYMARRSGSSDIVRNTKYIYSMKLLIHMLERSLFQAKIQDNLNKTVLLMCEIINAKDPMLMSNLYAVSRWAIRIARQMGLAEKELQKLQLAALMHNLGKIYIDEKVLNKEDKYTREDYEAMQRLCVHSYEIALRLGRIYDLEDIPEIILRFQERVDGTGYPGGLTGDSIPLLSKILNVARALAAMFTNKPYRKALPLYDIIKELKDHADTQFDREVAEAALVLLLYKKEDQCDYFTGIGGYATLSVTIGLQDSSTIQLWGQIRKNGDIYVFSPMGKAPAIDMHLITECALYMDINERILRFNIEIDQILKDRILLKNVEPQGEDDAFSIQWFLEGTLITNEKVIHKVYINLLGGDYLDFYIFNEENPGAFTSGIVKVILSDTKETFLPGMITFRQQMHDKIFFRFKYTNVSEAERQEVFSAMFRKQLEVRGQIKGTDYSRTIVPAVK